MHNGWFMQAISKERLKVLKGFHADLHATLIPGIVQDADRQTLRFHSVSKDHNSKQSIRPSSNGLAQRVSRAFKGHHIKHHLVLE